VCMKISVIIWILLTKFMKILISPLLVSITKFSLEITSSGAQSSPSYSFFLKACLNILRVNTNGSKECLPASSATLLSEKINEIFTANLFPAIFFGTSSMLSQYQLHHNIYIHPREVHWKKILDIWKSNVQISSILVKLTENICNPKRDGQEHLYQIQLMVECMIFWSWDHSLNNNW